MTVADRFRKADYSARHFQLDAHWTDAVATGGDVCPFPSRARRCASAPAGLEVFRIITTKTMWLEKNYIRKFYFYFIVDM